MKISSPNKSSFIKKISGITCASLLAIPVFAQTPIAPPPYSFWSVEGGRLLDPNGNPFIFRGVTINHTLAPEKTVQAIKDIAALGGNSAQIEFAIKLDGGYPRQVIAQLRDIIQTCKDSKLVCVLEANDASGYSQAAGSTSPSNIAYYWGISDMRAALEGSQGHIIIGFSNQIFDSNYNVGAYEVRMDTYLRELKSGLPTGYMVMIDGNKWGQDTDNAMLEYARKRSIYSESNDVIYSIDMFSAYTDPAKARDYIASFAQVGAPLVVGGFGPVPYYHPHNNGPRAAVELSLPAQSVMQYAQEFGTGYFAWSWSGNENPALDLVTNWNPQALTNWGNLAFNDVNGIKATAKPASIFNSSSSSSIIRSSSSSIRPSSSSVPSSVSSSSIRPSSSSRSSSSAIAAGNCSYVINSQWNNGFTATIRVKNTSAQPINGWSVNWQYTDGSKVTGHWNTSLTGSNPYTAKNLSWNSTIQPGQTVEFGFQGSKAAGGASVPVVTGSVCQ